MTRNVSSSERCAASGTHLAGDASARPPAFARLTVRELLVTAFVVFFTAFWLLPGLAVEHLAARLLEDAAGARLVAQLDEALGVSGAEEHLGHGAEVSEVILSSSESFPRLATETAVRLAQSGIASRWLSADGVEIATSAVPPPVQPPLDYPSRPAGSGQRAGLSLARSQGSRVRLAA